MTTAPAKPRRLVRIVLVLSLALNLLLAGLIVGAVASGRGGAPMRFQADLGPVAQVIPREDRAQIGREIRRELGRSGPSRRELGRTLDQIAAALEAETFDPQGFEVLIRSQQAWQDRVRDVALGAVTRHLATLSVDERRGIAAALRAQLQQRRGDGERSGG